MKFIFVLRGDIEALPPVISAVIGLRRLDENVVLVCERCSSSLQQRLSEFGVPVICPPRSYMVALKFGLVSRFFRWAFFYRFAWKSIRILKSSDDIIWVASGDTCISLGFLLRNQRYLLQLHEMYAERPDYRFFLRSFCKSAKLVVCPDIFRSAILKVWYGLDYFPHVLLNKQILFDDQLDIGHDNASQAAIDAIMEFSNGRKIAIYQGHIDDHRNVNLFIEAFQSRRDRWALILMGKDHCGVAAKLSSDKEDYVLYINYINPPYHLNITRLAALGLIIYSSNSINHIFCAPNKIWEYGRYGIPFIANNLAGLRQWTDKYRCGLLFDEKSVVSIQYAIDEIEKNYDEFSSGVQQMYDSIDMLKMLRGVSSFLHHKV